MAAEIQSVRQSLVVPRLKAPVLLVHGLFGFDRIQLAGWTLAAYFPGIGPLLEEAGNRVLVPRLSPTAGVAQRAAELKAFLDRHAPDEPVHILAHSLGGLDARHLISCLDMDRRVLTLTTFGTPHRGTTFADWGISRLERLVRPIFEFFSIPCEAFYDLTTKSCRQFNKEVRDSPRVRYFSVAGHHRVSWRHPEWLLTHGIIHAVEGPNDGLVSVASASYGEYVEVWDADHLGLVNLPNPLDLARGGWTDRLPQYAALIRRLADEGYGA